MADLIPEADTLLISTTLLVNMSLPNAVIPVVGTLRQLILE